MPIHNGHIALIKYAKSYCDELIVSMSYTFNDTIDSKLRYNWIREIFKDEPRIKVELILDDFDVEELALPERTKIWANKMKKVYPPVDVVISSEDYGVPFAENLGAECLIFNQERNVFPVSATLIRNNPFKYWDFIPAVVRPYFVKKICLYGPESTGKSTMAEKMAKLYNTEFVPEVARELIVNNDLTEDDFLRIAVAQTQRVIEKTKTANKLLFCDTDVITTQIYAKHYLGYQLSELLEFEKLISYDQYFLLNTDVAWVADNLRDLGDRREEMYTLFEQELLKRNINYISIEGNYEQRESIIKSFIDELIK
ncbi:ATPase [Pedobacter frigiditerrae]|uniref:ATPase n=2 Tax=Pedobacter frigiditerrae TaxID=2530452 RepID=A0A4R0N454_9SPHI|nr:ATPase [Pedobacter frigiditerrae]